MSELKLQKNPTVTRTLTGAKLTEDATFFGLHTQSLSVTMVGIRLTLNAKGHLEVTHESHPGKVYEVHPAGIIYLSWQDA